VLVSAVGLGGNGGADIEDSDGATLVGETLGLLGLTAAEGVLVGDSDAALLGVSLGLGELDAGIETLGFGFGFTAGGLLETVGTGSGLGLRLTPLQPSIWSLNTQPLLPLLCSI
jgi:hypothetical protein